MLQPCSCLSISLPIAVRHRNSFPTFCASLVNGFWSFSLALIFIASIYQTADQGTHAYSSIARRFP